MGILGIPLEIYTSQLIITIEVALLGSFLFQVYHFTENSRERLERFIWRGSAPEQSFGKTQGRWTVLRSLITSSVQVLGWRRVPFKSRMDLASMLITNPTCQWTERVFNTFGARTDDIPNAAILVHGAIYLGVFVVLEVVSLGAITGVGYAAYFSTGVTIDLNNLYQTTVAVLLLVTFSCLADANYRFRSRA